VFQQDIRRALMQVGRPFFSRDRGVDTGYVEEVSRGAISLSTSKTGGLIVMEKSVDLSAYFDTGVVIDAEISRELLLTIFNNNSPIHDGAVIVSKGRLFKAGCILPLTEKELARGLGTRHRAAVGLSEETDAVIVVISEKTGGISIVNEEKIDLGVEPTSVPGRLKRLLLPGGEGKKGLMSWRFRG
ncbi:MAG: DNA integrity scanning protein DisA nucleotide-binding domain protein, partial [Deltaproteobacteria bacterium]|nr:DNA integrity scanning protein DisA nucleotide-binding domain protein [Deltaproteobacteria bacterium]